MISDSEKRKIKELILKAIENENSDIAGLYYKEFTGDLHSRYLVARGEEAKIDAIGLQLVTSTRVSVAFTIKATLNANIPELYSRIEKGIKEQLTGIKYNLYSLKIKVIDIE